MPKTAHQKQLKTEKELGVILTILRTPNKSEITTEFAIHRLATLATIKPELVSAKINSEMSKDIELANSLEIMARNFPSSNVIRKVDPEIENVFVPPQLSGSQQLAAVFQEGLSLIATANEQHINMKRRMDDPRKTNERMETGTADEWDGRLRHFDDK